MAYPDGVLVDGEAVVLHRHPHWKVLVVPVLALLLVAGLGSYLAALLRDQGWAPVALGVVALVVVVWSTVLPVIRWRTTHLVVTSERVLLREGVLTRQGIDIPLSRVDNVRSRQTVVDRLLGCGTLIIESTSGEPLELDDVPGVEQVHTLLSREVADEA